MWSADPLTYRDRFTTLSLEASSVFHRTRVSVAVRNVTDASYREPMSFIPEAGRTVTLSVRHDFELPLSRELATP